MFNPFPKANYPPWLLFNSTLVLHDPIGTNGKNWHNFLGKSFPPREFNAQDNVGKSCFSSQVVPFPGGFCRAVLHWGNQRPTARWESVPKKKKKRVFSSEKTKPPKLIISSITLSKAMLKESAIYQAKSSLLPVSSQETLLKFISPQK